MRSIYPTNSVVAWGRIARELICDHEKSFTPFGKDTSYGRLVKRDDAYILMLETQINSLLHHLQERVNFPNLFLPDEKEVPIVDEEGKMRSIVMKVMCPRVTNFITIPSASGNKPDWVTLRDFALMFPNRREREVERLGYCFDGYPHIYRRRKDLEEAGILRSTKMGRGEIGLLHIKSFVAKIETELSDLIQRFRSV